MLILTRRLEQEFVFLVPPSTEPREIRCRVVRLRPDNARIGIEAPATVTVLRGELLEVSNDRQA